MNVIATIGTKSSVITYSDRPTVKVILRDGTILLLLNDGLLPGGGIDEGENDLQAIERELTEELGASVNNIKPLGTVVQYRDFLEKRYIINGYTADLVAFDKKTNPQDEGEKQFIYTWLRKDEAEKLVQSSIDAFDGVDMQDDSQQGKLFNLKTTLELLRSIK